MREIGMSELEKAREIQRQAVELHLPSPPVMWYEMKITNPDGSVADHLRAKSNSYVRNALNLLTYNLSVIKAGSSEIGTNDTFGDGSLAYKTVAGVTLKFLSRQGNVPMEVWMGTSGEAETIDSYTIQNPVKMRLATNSAFDPVTRKLITTSSAVVRALAPITIREVGVIVNYAEVMVALNQKNGYLLLVRDLIPETTLATDQAVTFTYVTEILYPA